MMVYKDKEKILKKLYSILESIGKENGLYIFLLTPKNAHSLKEYIIHFPYQYFPIYATGYFYRRRCFKFNEKN